MENANKAVLASYAAQHKLMIETLKVAALYDADAAAAKAWAAKSDDKTAKAASVAATAAAKVEKDKKTSVYTTEAKAVTDLSAKSDTALGATGYSAMKTAYGTATVGKTAGTGLVKKWEDAKAAYDAELAKHKTAIDDYNTLAGLNVAKTALDKEITDNVDVKAPTPVVASKLASAITEAAKAKAAEGKAKGNTLAADAKPEIKTAHAAMLKAAADSVLASNKLLVSAMHIDALPISIDGVNAAKAVTKANDVLA